MSEVIFDIGEICDNLFLIYQGVVSIEVTDQTQSKILDIMGRGSVIGLHGFLKNEPWLYKCKAISAQTVYIFMLPNTVLR